MIVRWLTRFLAAVFLFSPLVIGDLQAKSKPPAKFNDTCHCVGCHAEYRWDVKTDDEGPPDSVTNRVTPSEIGKWAGPGGIFKKDTPRKGKEKQWYALTGRATLVKIEPDGDIHIQLVDVSAGDGDLNVVVEVPFGEPWCDVRAEVFSWTNQNFPFHTQGKKFTLQKQPVVTIIGKAFFDAIHGGGDTSINRRPVPNNAAPTTRKVSIWEIHPVMKMIVQGQ